MKDKKLEIGQRMLELRKSLKKSQAEVAEYLKLTVSAYQNYEAGRREAGYDTIAKLADFYGVTTDYLLGRTDTKPDPYDMLTSEEFEQELLKEYFALPEQIRSEIRRLMKQAVIRSEERRTQIVKSDIAATATARTTDGSDEHFQVTAEKLASAEDVDDL